MFWRATGALLGGFDLFSQGDYSAVLPAGIPKEAFLIFQDCVLRDFGDDRLGARWPSGRSSARTAYIRHFISLIIYPVSGHWVWGGGWLAQLGFHDFAGSTAVHMVGGICALIGAAIIGPRIGKYDAKGQSACDTGPQASRWVRWACFILWFCWFGFNGCSTVSMTGDAINLASKVFVTTNLAAAVATVTTMIITWVKYKKPDVSMTLNGSLAGLVAITAGPGDTVSPWAAAVIGIIAGFAVGIWHRVH